MLSARTSWPSSRGRLDSGSLVERARWPIQALAFYLWKTIVPTGLAPLYAVLSFLRREGGAYEMITERAGEYAAEWTVEALPPVVPDPLCRTTASGTNTTE